MSHESEVYVRVNSADMAGVWWRIERPASSGYLPFLWVHSKGGWGGGVEANNQECLPPFSVNTVRRKGGGEESVGVNKAINNDCLPYPCHRSLSSLSRGYS